MISFKSVLSNFKIESLNEMQLASIKANQLHNNVIILSNTGSGKTLAFLLPLFQSLKNNISITQAIIVVPSRELALQIEQVFKTMNTGFKVTCCYGGHLRETEENNLIEPPALIIGTPGRLCDHIRRKNIDCSGIETLVLDEFDKSIEAGFEDEMAFIINSLISLKKRILTSATEALQIPDFIGLEDPVVVNFLNKSQNESLLIQHIISKDKDKIEILVQLLCMANNRAAIVFCNHRDAVERVSELLHEQGIVNVFYHGALEQPERDTALVKFKNGTSNVLITTDLASRGLDIPNIRYIIHYHLPGSKEIYTHRNGRTARMDASGTIILIIGPDEKLPDYIDADIAPVELPETLIVPEKPKWTTLFVGAGKKNKVNKIDIVGFLSNKAQLKKDDIGLIDVKDFFSYAAIRKNKAGYVLESIKNEKLKNKKIKISIAK